MALHFLRDLVETGTPDIQYISTDINLAEIFKYCCKYEKIIESVKKRGWLMTTVQRQPNKENSEEYRTVSIPTLVTI